MPEDISGDVSPDLSSVIPGVLSGEPSGDLSSELSGKPSSDLSSELSGEPSDDLSSELSGEPSDDLSSELSGALSSELSGDAPSDLAINLSGGAPSDVSDLRSGSPGGGRGEGRGEVSRTSMRRTTITMSSPSRITASLLPRRGASQPDVPVVGLRVLPHGPVFAFDSFTIEGRAKRILVIGADLGCDLVIDDDTVSGLHCLIERHRKRVLVHDCQSKNGTRVNGVTLQEGELQPGSLLTLGRVSLVAYGPDKVGAHRPRVTLPAASLDEFLRTAVEAHGSLRAAAEALGLPYSTLRGWLKKRIGGNGTSPR